MTSPDSDPCASRMILSRRQKRSLGVNTHPLKHIPQHLRRKFTLLAQRSCRSLLLPLSYIETGNWRRQWRRSPRPSARAPHKTPKQTSSAVSALLGSSFLLPSAASSCAGRSANLAFSRGHSSRRIASPSWRSASWRSSGANAPSLEHVSSDCSPRAFLLGPSPSWLRGQDLLFTPRLSNSNHYFCNIFACLQVSAKMDMVMFCLRAAPGHLRLRVFA